ncbi:MAG: hypothetical protein GF393_05280, partial [Armatimonadia bacterium]|nr:hypothetical protein [Armatimonadia bacterium]
MHAGASSVDRRPVMSGPRVRIYTVRRQTSLQRMEASTALEVYDMPFRWRNRSRICTPALISLVLIALAGMSSSVWCADVSHTLPPADAALLLAQAPETDAADTGETPPSRPASPLRPQAAGMILRPGDVLSISVQGEPQLTQQVHIRPDGLIFLPLLGEIAAAGKTVTELADQIREDLRAYVVNPIVSVIQTGGIPRVVSVIGAVRTPGTYDVRQYGTLLAALAAAGGPAPEADLARTVLVRDGEPARVSADVVPGEPVIPTDAPLQAGDAVIVPSLTERAVRVVGAVQRPGLVMLEEQMTASRAVLAAGGAAETADLTGVQLLRGAERMALNLRPILRAERSPSGEDARDAELQLEDIVIVPEAASQAVFVIGAVATPGPQPAREAARASRAVVMAGGAAPNADLGRAYILRDGVKQQLDLRPLLEADAVSPDVQPADGDVEPGDVVVIPEREPVFVIGAVRNPGALSPVDADTASRAVVLAGGLTEDADKTDAYVLREGEQVALDLIALFDEADSSADVPLRPRDAVVVPSAPQVFSIVGEVMQPGTYPVAQAETVLEAWSLGGGPTLMADSSNSLLVRGEETEVINIDALVHSGDLSQNRTLGAGDTILVPRIQDEVYVFGAVARPGAHPIHDGDTFIDVIADAGGPTTGANVKKIAVIRRSVVEETRRETLYERRDRPRREQPGAARTRGYERRRPSPTDRGPRPDAEEAPEDQAEKVAQELAEGT